LVTQGQERRNLALRARRDAIAAWFDVHPRALAGLPAEVVETMAQRLDAELAASGKLAELQSTVQRWEELARTDPLTGLANRRAAEERLAQECDRARRYGHPLTVLLADVDHLKAVNDGHGHPVGDLLLREVAGRLRRVVRGSDLVARWGGDEFLVTCPETDAESARLVAAKLVRTAQEAFVAGGVEIDCGVSVGWSTGTGGEVDARVLVRAADQALYRSKQQGRGRATGPG
jgi:diguanylate cyclase (GGDEF)-like protein